MKSKTAKLISPERVVQLLDCYGANPRAWPEEERPTALALIQHSAELKRLQEEAAQLDHLLVSDTLQKESYDKAENQLVSRIVNALPEQDKPSPGRKTGQPVSGSSASFFGSGHWLGMIAASVAVFVISISILNLRPSDIEQPPAQMVQQELDAWMWDQINGDIDSDDEEPLTMMSFMELSEL